MIACEGDRCVVSGPITMGNVTAVLEESRRLFNGQRVVVDLGGLTDVDSSAVSLLLEWQREAAKAGRAVELTNVPADLKTLADLYGVLDLLVARGV